MLGRWDQYLAMQQGILELNRRCRDILSNDLDASAAFLFDVGNGCFNAPPVGKGNAAKDVWLSELSKARETRNGRKGRSRSPARTTSPNASPSFAP